MDSDELVREFKAQYEKAQYEKRGSRDLMYQVPHLAKLARRYQEKDDWTSLLRAHSLYNSCAVRDKESRDQWSERAYEVQLKYWRTDLQNFYQHQLVGRNLKCELESIRDEWREKTERIADLFQKLDCEPDRLASSNNQELYSQILRDIPHLSSYITQDLLKFTWSVIERALTICGPPACSYCVVALGSLARGEATPYSDLEFLFLIDSDSKPEEVIEYFERFAVTTYFLIGNLGETKLKYMAIPELMSYNKVSKKTEHWFTDSSISGFKIDGLGMKAGNIPTGNGSLEQQNHFICNVEELARRYKSVLDNPDPEKSLKGDLTAMLASTVYVSGDHRLHDNLRSVIASYKSNDQRQLATVKMMESDANNFDFRPDIDLTHTRQVKDDIHRYPSLLILNLKILYQIPSCDPWEIIQILETQAVITSETAKCLKFSLCCAQIIRLSAYFYHNSQNEAISVLSSRADENLYKGAWYLRPELLVHMFIHLMPLKRAVSRIAGTGVSPTIVTSMSDQTALESVALTRYCCGEYQSVVDLLRSTYPNGLELADFATQQRYLHSAIQCSQYEEAVPLLTKRVQSRRYDGYDFYLLARIYQDQCKFPQALESYMTRLAILVSLHDFTDHGDIAQSYCNIGVVLESQGSYSEALIYLTKCLEMRLRIYGNRDHVKISDILCNMGTVLRKQGKYKEALMQYKKSLDMSMRIYGDRDHVDIADVLCNVGVALQNQKEYSEALKQHTKCLDTYRRIYGDRDHVKIATVLCNMAGVLQGQSKYAEALDKYQTSLNMYRRIHEGRDDVGIAGVLCNIGIVLRYLNRYRDALVHYKRSLDMYKRIFGDVDHPAINQVKRNLGILVTLMRT